MPGILRFFLSSLVVFSHLSGLQSADHFGYYAVRSFFILSGFVLTKSLHETYQFNFVAFYSNRLLRIVPLYLVVCEATILVIHAFPEQAGDFVPRWAFQESTNAMVQNFLLFPLAAGYLKLRYVEPAWSLAVELVMYLFLWLGMSRSKQMAMLCLIFGTAYHFVLLAKGADFSERYFGIASPIFSYAIGALVYFYYDRLTKNWKIGAGAAVLWFCNIIFGSYVLGGHVLDIGFYANSILFGFAMPFLLEIKLSNRMREHDAMLGHLSYPLFLVQWLAGFVVYMALDGYEGRSVLIFYVAMPVSVLMATILMRLNALVVEPLRERLRGNIERMQVGDLNSSRFESAH